LVSLPAEAIIAPASALNFKPNFTFTEFVPVTALANCWTIATATGRIVAIAASKLPTDFSITDRDGSPLMTGEDELSSTSIAIVPPASKGIEMIRFIPPALTFAPFRKAAHRSDHHAKAFATNIQSDRVAQQFARIEKSSYSTRAACTFTDPELVFQLSI
jgi:hypothetical protein